MNHDEGKYSREAFAGMLVRGTCKNAIAYFLEHRRIIELVEYVCARPRGEQACAAGIAASRAETAAWLPPA